MYINLIVNIHCYYSAMKLSELIKKRVEDVLINPKAKLFTEEDFTGLSPDDKIILDSFESVIGMLRNSSFEVERLESSMVSSQKLESLGTMAAGMAHEFNNILQPISGFSDIMRNTDDIPEKYHDWMDIIFNSSQRGSGLVDQIMNFSRRNKDTQKKSTLVSEIMNEFFEIMTMSKELNVEVEIDNFTNPDHRVMVNSSEIIQVLVNLYNNAMHAVKSEQKGVISILATNTSSLTNFDTQSEWVSIEVQDNGYGIPQENLSKIFDPFYTTKPIGEGTGLGLSVINNIIMGNDADISVESEDGVGTVFKLLFKVDKE